MYAEKTEVPVERSRGEIERLLSKHKCVTFSTGIDRELLRAVVQFKAHARLIRFVIDLPNPAVYRKKVEQAERQRWRALLLVIKAKLEAVDNKISVFEEEFLAHIVLPNNRTVAETVLPEIARIYEMGRVPTLLLTAPATEGEVVG